MVSMDVTIVNVALPAIRQDLRASVAGLQWSIDGYTVVVASFLLLAGSMGDRPVAGARSSSGSRSSASARSSAASPRPPARSSRSAWSRRSAARCSTRSRCRSSSTPSPTRRSARAPSASGARSSASRWRSGRSSAGCSPSTSGGARSSGSTSPSASTAIVLTARFVPESRAERPRRVDPVGQVLIVVALGSLTSGVIDGRRLGWSSPIIVLAFALAAAAVAALIVYEARRVEPLLDLRFFRSLPFAAATLIAVLAFACFSGFLFLNSLYLQEARGLPPSAAGLCTLPIALALMVCSPLSGRLVGAGHVRLRARRRRRRDRDGGAPPRRPAAGHAARAAGRRVRGLRRGPRHGERADHEHRRLRDAARAGGARGGGGVDEPPGRGVARRRHRRDARRRRHRVAHSATSRRRRTRCCGSRRLRVRHRGARRALDGGAGRASARGWRPCSTRGAEGHAPSALTG